MTNEKCACRGSNLTRFLQPIILYSLAESPDHGYNLLQKIAATELWHDSTPDATGVYRVLRDMEKRNLIRSHMDSDSKAATGKRVFEITDEGRRCMSNWIETLEDYRRGIDRVISRLRSADADNPLPGEPFENSAAPCCCKKS